MSYRELICSPQTTLQAFARPAVRSLRTLPVRASHAWQRGRGPVAVFLPYRGREEASFVRIYAIAAALRPLGWQTLVLPWKLTLKQRQRLLASLCPDVVVMQGVRHPLNQPALYPGVPIVMDMDDADFHLHHLTDRLSQALPDLAGVIAGSQYVADWCRTSGCAQTHVIWTGMPISQRPLRVPHAQRAPVIAWAQTRPMTYKHEARFVRDVVAKLAQQRPGLRLRLYDRCAGDDGSFKEWFEQAGISVEWRKRMKFRDYIRSFDDVAIGLAPLSLDSPFSQGKSFGKVLAYLDSRVPVICSDAGEHGGFFTPEIGVMSNDPAVWEAAALRLLDDPASRQHMANAAFDAFRKTLSLEAAAAKTDSVLRGCIAQAH